MQDLQLTLLLSLLGIGLLLALTFMPPRQVASEKELAFLEENQNVVASGTVIRSANNNPLLIMLDNNITIVTTLPLSLALKGKKIRVRGSKESYKGKSQIRAQHIALEP